MGHLATTGKLAVAESRDPKGLYKNADALAELQAEPEIRTHARDSADAPAADPSG